jgi:competence protein ComEC
MRGITRYFKLGFLIFLASAVFLVWHAVFAENKQNLTVAFLDVGQGDAIFIDTPEGRQILIDGGPNKKVLSELSKVMPFYDRSIDVVIATHPDQDHIGGLLNILERYKVDLIIEPGVDSAASVYDGLENLIEEKGIKKILARRGMKLALSEDIYLLFLFPDRDVLEMTSNYASIVAKLVYGDTSFLFTGDSPKEIERYLVFLSPSSLNSDVLKVAHHGSKTSTSEIFVGYVNPKYAVISTGRGNRYGHPHKEVLDILRRFDVSILRIDKNGTIEIKSDGKVIEIFE